MRAKILPVVLLTVAAMAFVFAWQQRVSRREMEAAVVKAQSRRGRLDADIRESQRRMVAADAEHRRLQGELEAARRKLTEPPPSAVRKPPAMRTPVSAVRDALLNDPQMQNLQLAVVHSKLTNTYLPFCEQLQLSHAQRAQFSSNLRRRGEQEMDFSAIMETQPPRDDPAIARLVQQNAAEFRAAQIAVLGEEGFRKFADYERSVPAWEFVNELAGAAAILGHGITPAQADQLVKAMAEASAAYRQGRMATRNIGDIDWDSVMARAGDTLSRDQLGVFNNAVIQSRNMDRIRQLARGK